MGPDSTAPGASPRSRLATGRRALWLVVLAALLAHAPGLGGGYTFDDMAAVLGHPAVTGRVPLVEVFTREYWGRPLDAGWSSSYRPITTLTFALSHRLAAAPWLHHLINWLLYAGLCGLVVVFLRRRLPAAQAIAAGLLFAVWPIHVENVASIVGRADVLAAGFALIALILAEIEPDPAAKHPALRRLGYATAAALAYLLALLSKEGVALLPGLAGWLWLLRRRELGDRWWPQVTGVVALAVMGLLYLAVRQALLPVGLPAAFVGADNTVAGLSGPARWWANAGLLGTYAEIAVVPVRLCVDHTYGDVMPATSLAPTTANAARAWLGAGLLGVVGWDARRALRGRSAGLAVAAALAYVLVGQWLIDLSVTLAERLFLWPSVFAAGALAAAGAHLLATQPATTRRRLLVAAIVLLTLYAGRSAQRSLDWRTPLTLYRSSARACPAAVHNRLSLAKAWQRAGRPDEALWNYGLALAGHRAWPKPFAPPALAVETQLPLAERLRRLPTLVALGGPPERVWPALASWLQRRGATREAALARQFGAQGQRSAP